MKWLWIIIAVLLIVVGIVWILQGINVLPGSFMTGNIRYTYLGILLDILGVAILASANRRPNAVAGDDQTKR